MKENSIKINREFISSYSLKMIAICAMLIDHIAWAFVPTYSFEGQLMHVIGRVTAPIMCYFVAEGYYYTRNLSKYILRMAVFAVISHFAFSYFETGTFFYSGTSVIYTLLLGLISLAIWKSPKIMEGIKFTLILILLIVAMVGDWACISVLWVLFFGVFRGNKKMQIISFSVVGLLAWLLPLIYMLINNQSNWYQVLFQLGIYLAIPLIISYNGTLGGNKNMKWLFYIFYPAHLFVIGIIKWIIMTRIP